MDGPPPPCRHFLRPVRPVAAELVVSPSRPFVSSFSALSYIPRHGFAHGLVAVHVFSLQVIVLFQSNFDNFFYHRRVWLGEAQGTNSSEGAVLSVCNKGL